MRWWLGGIFWQFIIQTDNVSLRKYFYVLAIKKAPFHSNTSPYNTPSSPQPNTSSLQNYRPVSATFRYTSTVSFQTADTTTVETTHLRKTLRQTFTYIVCCEDGECLCWGTQIIRFLTITECLFLRPSHGGDILLLKGSKATSKALPFVKCSDGSYGVHLPNIVR